MELKRTSTPTGSPVGLDARPAPDGAELVDESPQVKASSPVNAMSIDVEEHFQVSAFESAISRDDWDQIPSRIEQNVNRLLRLLHETNSKATFFTLGWIAERHQALIRKIVDSGHELASHGFDHKRVSGMSPEQFLADVGKTKTILEDVSGSEVRGYRAPSFSINEDVMWAHDALQEAGYTYSSSIYPVKHDHYGAPLAPRFPYRRRPGGILEIPPATVALGKRNLPAAGGGYFRLLPLLYSRWALRRINNQERMPAAFYFHPWEIDPEQPRISHISSKARLRHYVNLGRFERRLTDVLREFSWDRMDKVYRRALGSH